MQRILQNPRENWQQKLIEQGFFYHSIDEKGNDVSHLHNKFIYWREDVAYCFTEKQVEKIESVTNELHQMCLVVANDLVKNGDLSRLNIPFIAQELITNSFNEKQPGLYGRFDIAWNGIGEPKMLEYNADTPTSIIESGIAQWFWRNDVHPSLTQFNNLHQMLVERWSFLQKYYNLDFVHFGCFFESQEDVGNTQYVQETANQAGLKTKLFHMPDIGKDINHQYLDSDDYKIKAIFKLFPWEFFFVEDLFKNFNKSNTVWIEPIWKAILSNKAILPILWEKFPKHPNLLEAHFSSDKFNGNYVKKPVLSREGANIEIINENKSIINTPGSYTKSGYIYQEHYPMPEIDAPEKTGWLETNKVYPVIGSWVVGDKSAGICLREDISPITKNTSYFVPHYVKN